MCGVWAAAYLVQNLAYSLRLKQVAFVDVVLIAAGITIMNKSNTDLVPWAAGAATVGVVILFAIVQIVQIILTRIATRVSHRSSTAVLPKDAELTINPAQGVAT